MNEIVFDDYKENADGIEANIFYIKKILEKYQVVPKTSSKIYFLV